MMRVTSSSLVVMKRFGFGNGIRSMSASNKTAKHPFALRLDNQNTFREGFLQDPSVYPLIAILGAGLTFMCAMGGHAITSYKDVQVDPVKRNAKMQTWGHQEQDSLTKRWTRRATKRMNLHEGLGIDHDEWVRQQQKNKTSSSSPGSNDQQQ